MAKGKSGKTTTIVAEKQRSDDERPPDSCALLVTMAGKDVGRVQRIDGQRKRMVLGREDDADIHVADAEVSRQHARIRYDRGAKSYWLRDLESRNGTRLNGESCETERRVNPGDLIELGSQAVLRFSLASEVEANYAQKMAQAVARDGLTGTFNRRYLNEQLEREVSYSKRRESPLALLMLDLDHFKAVNDTYGHRAGDAVLQQTCQLLERTVRAEDVVARFGGEEFAVLCRDTDQWQAGILAERLRQAVEEAAFQFEGKPIPVTVSIGVAALWEGGTASSDSLVEAADRALYRAKSSGRNCCCFPSPEV